MRNRLTISVIVILLMVLICFVFIHERNVTVRAAQRLDDGRRFQVTLVGKTWNDSHFVHLVADREKNREYLMVVSADPKGGVALLETR